MLVLFTGRPLTIKWENDNVPAIINVWFGGTEAGDAIADVLFGNVNPSGKLSTTFPSKHWPGASFIIVIKIPGARSPMDNGFKKFRSNYLDVSNDPVYPFGYGLSYTTFSYSDITLSSTSYQSQ